jgi:hypothetical protein
LVERHDLDVAVSRADGLQPTRCPARNASAMGDRAVDLIRSAFAGVLAAFRRDRSDAAQDCRRCQAGRGRPGPAEAPIPGWRRAGRSGRRGRGRRAPGRRRSGRCAAAGAIDAGEKAVRRRPAVRRDRGRDHGLLHTHAQRATRTLTHQARGGADPDSLTGGGASAASHRLPGISIVWVFWLLDAAAPGGASLRLPAGGPLVRSRTSLPRAAARNSGSQACRCDEESAEVGQQFRRDWVDLVAEGGADRVVDPVTSETARYSAYRRTSASSAGGRGSG